MASDCTVAIDNGYINIRVGAIIMKGNKFLMVGNQKDEYLYSVGGRIQFGESAGVRGQHGIYHHLVYPARLVLLQNL